jgi:Tfp pilus assembly protein PilF
VPLPNNPVPNERLQKLQSMLQHTPDDTFLLYALAMEHKKAQDFTAALGYFGRVIERDPGYCVAYHQAALTHEAAGDLAAARTAFHNGIAAAARKGDFHAKEEMEAALALLDG